MYRLRYLSIYAFFMVTLLTSSMVVANQREDAIKSGFIYNFARYSQGAWFNSFVDKSYNICSFNPEFNLIASHTLKDRSINHVPVILSLLSSKFDSISHCHTLFITKNDLEAWSYLAKQLPMKSIMLVGEFDDFIATGGYINFFIVGGKIRFEVNPDKLKQSGINMSSKVLRLGRTKKAKLQ